MVGKPLYVLTSGGTGSAAEGFVGHVGGYRLGEVVGETTAGAGFRNDLLPIAGGFILSVSVARAVLASTGKDWEVSASSQLFQRRPPAHSMSPTPMRCAGSPAPLSDRSGCGWKL